MVGSATQSSTQSVTIHARPDAVMSVIADFEAYPEWAEAIKAVDVTAAGSADRAARVKFAMDAGLIKDTYELEYTWADDGLSVAWDLVSGELQKAQHGSYRLRPMVAAEAGGPITEVTYTLSVELAIPLVVALRRKAERVIMDTALGELRRRVEERPGRSGTR